MPSLPRDRDPEGLWGRKASDIGVDLGAALLISEIPDPELRGGLLMLLDALGEQGITRAPSQESKEQILRNTALSDPRAAAGVAALIGMTLFLHYGAPDPQTGQNPNWKTFRYPGPISPPPQVEKPLRIHGPQGSEETLEADVCIVGSGSGGAVVAAVLAARGLDVIVLEAAGYYNESDFTQLELPAYQQMFWRGGPNPTADGNVSLVAGTTLGGGTTINWTNCLRTRPSVRKQWAEHGLDGVDGPEFDRHMDAVWERVTANERCSDLNGTQQRLREGAEALGWSFETIVRNTDPETYTPEQAGYLGFGDQSGSKRSADRTWLADAQEHGARFLTFTRAARVLTEAGRASGVEAVWQTPDGRGAKVTVRRRASSSPGARSNRRRCCCAPASAARRSGRTCGCTRRASSAAPTARTSRPGGGRRRPGSATSSPIRRGLRLPDRDRAVRARPDRLRDTLDLGRGSQAADGGVPLHRDVHLADPRPGSGPVGVDANGEAVPIYAVRDQVDLREAEAGIEVQIRLHEAAGAHPIGPLAEGAPTWRRGTTSKLTSPASSASPSGRADTSLFSAHQMGTCRMGRIRETSVAGPRGELHDTKGVWIGDGSAFPTPSGRRCRQPIHTPLVSCSSHAKVRISTPWARCPSDVR